MIFKIGNLATYGYSYTIGSKLQHADMYIEKQQSQKN